MKRHWLLKGRVAELFLLLWLAIGFAAAQQANITAPVAGPTSTKVLVQRIEITRGAPTSALIELSFQDVSSNEIERRTFRVPQDPNNPGTEIGDFLTAMITVRATETGGSGRKLNFRVLGFLADGGRLSGVTLAP